MNKKELFDKYCQEAQIQMDCTYKGDYKNGNIASEKLEKYNAIIKKDFINNINIVDELLASNNPNVCIWISCVALDENYRIDFIKDKLTKLSNDNNIGIIGFNAKMLLKTKGLL